MTRNNGENLIEQLITAAKQGRLDSDTEISNLIVRLASLPKFKAPRPDLMRIKGQVLDRIAIPQTENSSSRSWIGLLLKTGGSIVAGLLVVVSLTVGTAVAALESNPGDPMYSLKKIVENVQLKLVRGDEQKANLQLKLANKRLEELEVVLKQSEQGEMSADEAQKIVSETVQNLEKITAAVSTTGTKASQNRPQIEILTKIVSLSNKQSAVLKSASIKSEGQAKIEIDKALETSQISKEKAIENIERAGLVVEEQPIAIEEKVIPVDKVTVTGKLTAVSDTSISIGTARFLLTKDTEYANMQEADLAVDQLVDISAVVVDNKTEAIKITLVKSETKEEPTEPTETQ